MQKYLVYLFKIFFSLTVLYFIFLRVDLKEVLSQIKNVNFVYLFLSFLSACLATVINSKKWQILIQSAQLKIRLKHLIYFNFLSLFYSSFLPGGLLTGETIKCYKVTRGQVSKNKIILSVVFDRLTTFISYVFMGAFFLLLVYPKQIKNYQILLTTILAVAAATILLALAAFSPRIINFVFNLLNKPLAFFSERKARGKLLLKLNRSKYLEISHKLKEGILIYRQKKQIFYSVFFYGFLAHFLGTLFLWFSSLSLGLEIYFLHFFWLNTFVTILILIPVTIFGLGIRESSLIYFLSLLGIGSVSALSLSVLVSAVNLIIGLTGGFLELINIFKRIENV